MPPPRFVCTGRAQKAVGGIATCNVHMVKNVT